MLQTITRGLAVTFRWSLILFFVGWAFSILAGSPLRVDSLMLTALTTSLGLAGVSAFLASISGSPEKAPLRAAALEFFAASILLAQGIAVLQIGGFIAVWSLSQLPNAQVGWPLPVFVGMAASLAALGAASVAAWRWGEAGRLLRDLLSETASDRPLERVAPASTAD